MSADILDRAGTWSIIILSENDCWGSLVDHNTSKTSFLRSACPVSLQFIERMSGFPSMQYCSVCFM